MTTFDPLEGITEKTTKAQLIDRLNTLADQVRNFRKAESTRISEIEKRVREKHKPHDRVKMQYVVLGGTQEEHDDMVAFLADFDDILPTMLDRYVQGVEVLKEVKGA